MVKYYSDRELFNAVSGADDKIIAEYLALKGDSPAHRRTRNSLLHEACSCRRLEIARMLLEAGANPNSLDIDGNAALMKACKNPMQGNLSGVVGGSFVTVKLPEVDMESSRQMALIKLLVEKGAEVNPGKREMITDAEYLMWKPPLQVAAEEGNEMLVSFLLEHGADPKLKDYGGATALSEAVQKGFARIAKMLADAGSDLDCHYGSTRITPLYSVMNGRGNAMSDLMVHEDEMDAGKIGAATADIEKRYSETLGVLLAAGVKLDEHDGSGKNAGCWAIDNRWAGALAMLLGAGMDPGARDASGRTLLIYIAARMAELAHIKEDDMAPLVRILMDAGADAEARDKGGMTAGQIATRAGRKKIAALLEHEK
jgi:ankyrin repeat protein